MEAKPDYSIIIPVYYNERSLRITLDKLKENVIDPYGKTCEIIFVDDGSGDNSLNELLVLREENPQLVKIIKLSRNFGQVYARIAGYEYASGKCLIHHTADLQDPPKLICTMLDYFFKENYDIVICNRSSRDEPAFRRFTSKIFYTAIKKLSFSNMPTGGFDFHLISEKVKNIILKNQEANPFFQGQVLWTGLPTKFIPYKREKRTIGKSRWTLGKKIKLLIDGILGYTFFPLRLMAVVGFVVAFLGFVYAFSFNLSRVILKLLSL